MYGKLNDSEKAGDSFSYVCTKRCCKTCQCEQRFGIYALNAENARWKAMLQVLQTEK